jgi:hypothetical protein
VGTQRLEVFDNRLFSRFPFVRAPNFGATFQQMNVLWLLGLLFFLPLLLFGGKSHRILIAGVQSNLRIAWLALSSCLGDRFRARVSNITLSPRQAIFERNYLRTFSSGGQTSWEHIEMEAMLEDNVANDEDFH